MGTPGTTQAYMHTLYVWRVQVAAGTGHGLNCTSCGPHESGLAPTESGPDPESHVRDAEAGDLPQQEEGSTEHGSAWARPQSLREHVLRDSQLLAALRFTHPSEREERERERERVLRHF